MARIDDYNAARKIAIDTLSTRTFDGLCRTSGFEAAEEDRFWVPFLDKQYRVDYPAFGFTNPAAEDQAVPIQEQVLILHYMIADGDHRASGKWISYREIPGAAFYFASFVKRAIDPLKKTFGQNPAALETAAGLINGKAIDEGDVGFAFDLFPRISLRLILWEGDDEFTPEATIVFQDTIGDMLSPEDVAWLSGMLVYRLMALSR
ncbi:MAG: DUF3786 domain-containing protein [Desulfobacterales bacterium]